MGDKGSQDKSWILKIVNAKTNSIKTCKCPIESITVSSREKSDIQMSLPFIELDHIAINFEEEKIYIIGNGILPNTILSYNKNSIIRICNVFIGIQAFDESYADEKYLDTMINIINVYRESKNILGIENRSNETNIKDYNNDLISKIVTIINPCEIDDVSQSNVKQIDKNYGNFGIVGLDKIKGPDNSLFSEADNNLIKKKDDNIRSVTLNTNETKNKDEEMISKLVNNQIMDQPEKSLTNNFDIYKEDSESIGNKLKSVSDGNAELADAVSISNKNNFQSQIDKRSQEMVGVLEDFYKKELGDFSSIPPLKNAPMNYSGDAENINFSPNEASPPKQVISETKKEFEETYHVEPPNNVLEAAIETKIEGVKGEVINVLEGDIDIPFKKQHTNDLGTMAIENEILNDAIDEIKACTPEEEGRKAEFLEAQINSFDQLRNTITDTIKEDMRESIKEIVHDEVETKLKDLKNNVEEEEPAKSQNKSCQLEDHAEKRTTDDDQSKTAKKAKVDDSKIEEDKSKEALSHTSDKEILEKKSPKRLKQSDASAEQKIDSLNESAEKEKKGPEIASNKDKSKKTKDSVKDQPNKDKSKKAKDSVKDQPNKDEPETDTKDESQKEADRPIKKKAPAKKVKEEMPETPKKGKQAKSAKESNSPKKKKTPVKENIPEKNEKKGRSKK